MGKSRVIRRRSQKNVRELRARKKIRKRRRLKSWTAGVKNAGSCRFIPQRPTVLNNSLQEQFSRRRAESWHHKPEQENSFLEQEVVYPNEESDVHHQLKTKCENVYRSCLEQSILGNASYKVLNCSSRKMSFPNQQSLDSLVMQDTMYKDNYKKVGDRPDKKLNAPGLSYDPSQNIIDSGKDGQLAIGLDDVFYIYSKDGEVRELNENYCYYNPNGHRVTSLKFSNNGHYLAVAWENTRLIIWDVKTGKWIRELRSGDAEVSCPPGVVNDISFSGQYIIIACANGNIQFHDSLQKFSLVAELCYHKSAITSTAWSCDQSHFAAVDITGLITIWNKLFVLNECKTTCVMRKPKNVFKLACPSYSLC